MIRSYNNFSAAISRTDLNASKSFQQPDNVPWNTIK
jgi:hypothetical protein